MKKLFHKDTDILNKRSFSQKVVFGIFFVIFLVYAISLVAPLLYLLVNSFQGKNEYFTNLGEKGNAFSLPSIWHFENYKTAFNGMHIYNSVGDPITLLNMFINSIWYTLLSSSFGVLISSFTAYALSKYKFVGRNFIYGLAIFTMTIPIIGSTGATFKLLSDIGVYNTPFFLITSLGGFGFNFLVLYGFFKNLSWDYAEAVFIDGGSHAVAFFKVMLPQAASAMFALLLMAGISCWNDYTTPLLYLPDYPTIASGLYAIQTSFKRTGDMPAYFAGLVLSIIPVIVVFAFFSDTIMKNLSVGGLKG